jgi:hypothetical protein
MIVFMKLDEMKQLRQSVREEREQLLTPLSDREPTQEEIDQLLKLDQILNVIYNLIKIKE